MGLPQYFSFQTGRSASSSNFQGTVIRIKGFPTENRLSQKYLEKKSTVGNKSSRTDDHKLVYF